MASQPGMARLWAFSSDTQPGPLTTKCVTGSLNLSSMTDQFRSVAASPSPTSRHRHGTRTSFGFPSQAHTPYKYRHRAGSSPSFPSPQRSVGTELSLATNFAVSHKRENKFKPRFTTTNPRSVPIFEPLSKPILLERAQAPGSRTAWPGLSSELAPRLGEVLRRVQEGCPGKRWRVQPAGSATT